VPQPVPGQQAGDMALHRAVAENEAPRRMALLLKPLAQMLQAPLLRRG